MIRNKPAGLADSCFTAKLEEVKDPAKCKAMFPVFANVRVVAGAPPSDDRLKCELKPIDKADYKRPVTDAQLASLRTVFPQGVCDYTKKGVSQSPADIPGRRRQHEVTLRGKTLFISGGSRGIGLAIALRAAADGANVAIAAKTTEPHPKLPGTIFTAAAAIDAAGGHGLALAVDIRDEAQVGTAVARTVETFGGIDILVNNASAISLTPTPATSMKRFDLMHQVNTRGTYLCTQQCLPHLKRAANPHVLMISPPLNLDPRWFAPHVAYTIAKYGMSLCVLGMAEEFRADGIAVNALWPRTVIDTAALQALPGFGVEQRRQTRSPSIVSDAAHVILTRAARSFTGQFYLDEDVLRASGVRDFVPYRHEGATEADLLPDLFL